MEEGGRLSAQRVWVRRSRETGVQCLEDGSELELVDVAIEDTRAESCAELPEGAPGSCVEDGVSHGAGDGLVVAYGCRASIAGFSITGAQRAGISVSDAELEAHRGVITENGLGINIQTPGYDLGLLSDEVYVFGNLGQDFSQEEISVPDPMGLIESP